MTAQVLVVEDDPDVRDSIVDLLHAEVPWIEVSSATDGMEALELLEQGAQPSLALLDVMMPVMNGVEFLDTLRERRDARGPHLRLRAVRPARDVPRSQWPAAEAIQGDGPSVHRAPPLSGPWRAADGELIAGAERLRAGE